FATSIQPIGQASAVCEKIVVETVQRLEGMGHLVEPGCPDFSDIVEPFKTLWQAGVTSAGIPLEALSPMNRWIAEQSGSAGEYLQAVTKLQIIARQIVGFFNNYDVLVLPTYLHPPIRIGEWDDFSSEETLENIINWIGPCPPFNATGLPAIAIPAGFDDKGLPVGIQLVGPPASEATLLALAAQLEAANPWIHNRPTIATEV
ncbi:MAG: amidase, partial [Moorea sp. SIO2I5]|nr:amidase [Moorena sp. SIO2I5]